MEELVAELPAYHQALRRLAQKRNDFRKMSPTPIRLVLRILTGKEVTALKKIPDLL